MAPPDDPNILSRAAVGLTGPNVDVNAVVGGMEANGVSLAFYSRHITNATLSSFRYNAHLSPTAQCSTALDPPGELLFPT